MRKGADLLIVVPVKEESTKACFLETRRLLASRLVPTQMIQ